MLSHPAYPTLYSITNILDHFGIENIALEVLVNMETFKELPSSYISRTSEANKFVGVAKRKSAVDLFSGDKLKKAVSFTEFLKIRNGSVVTIDKEHTQERNERG